MRIKKRIIYWLGGFILFLLAGFLILNQVFINSYDGQQFSLFSDSRKESIEKKRFRYELIPSKDYVKLKGNDTVKVVPAYVEKAWNIHHKFLFFSVEDESWPGYNLIIERTNNDFQRYGLDFQYPKGNKLSPSGLYPNIGYPHFLIQEPDSVYVVVSAKKEDSWAEEIITDSFFYYKRQ